MLMAEFLTAARRRAADQGGHQQQQLARPDPVGADGARLPRARRAVPGSRSRTSPPGPPPAAASAPRSTKPGEGRGGDRARRWPSTARRWSTSTSTRTSRRCPARSPTTRPRSSPRRSCKGQPHKVAIATTLFKDKIQQLRALRRRHDAGVAADPVVRPRRAAAASTSARLERDLRAAGRRRGPVRRGQPRRLQHRRVELPAGADRRRGPAHVDDGVAGGRGLPASSARRSLSRGGGTSLAGQACNVAVVIDWSKYCHRRRLGRRRGAGPAWSSPASCSTSSTRSWRRTELMFGPKPATHDHCTLGGMIGNNSCGSTAQAYGKTVDNVRPARGADLRRRRGSGSGRPATRSTRPIVAAGGRRAEIYRALRGAARRATPTQIRERYPDIPRRVSGYNLDSLLPENGFDVGRALVGSESTLVTVLRAELAAGPRARRPGAGRARLPGHRQRGRRRAAASLPHEPEQLEGLDDRLITFERERRMNPEALRLLPEGRGWLMVSFTGDSQDEADARAAGPDRRPARRPSTSRPSKFYDDPEHEKRAGRRPRGGPRRHRPGPGHARHLGGLGGLRGPAGAARRLPARPAQAATTSSATRARRCTGTSARAACTPGSRSTWSPPTASRRSGVRRARPPTWCVSYGGSLSGEHGDGQARGELLPKMFGDELVRAFGQFKAIFDPDNRMNPGKVVAPYRLDEQPAARRRLDAAATTTALQLPGRRRPVRPRGDALRRASASAAHERAAA